MIELILQFVNIIGNQTSQQQALSIIVLGSVGLGLVGLIIRLVSKIKAAAFLGG